MFDTGGTGALTAAVAWIQAAMLGTVALAVAQLAVAGVGLLMLTGRIDWRRGATVILGCFVLLGAPMIAGALAGLASGDTPPPAFASAPQPIVPLSRPTRATEPGYDPYAGAAPARQN
jgi:type IV secretory pathway VirB2 component (pilin)